MYFDIYSGMAEFLQRSMTAKSRQKQPSPLAPNGKLLIEMERLKASRRLPYDIRRNLHFCGFFSFSFDPKCFCLRTRVQRNGLPCFPMTSNSNSMGASLTFPSSEHTFTL